MTTTDDCTMTRDELWAEVQKLRESLSWFTQREPIVKALVKAVVKSGCNDPRCEATDDGDGTCDLCVAYQNLRDFRMTQ